MKVNTEPVRGTKDFNPKETILRDYVKNTILETYRKNGFMHIKTPILEDINLLCKSDDGDNTKIMFKVLKRGQKLDIENAKKENDLCDMGLRYDLTVPLARFYANNQNLLPKPFKSIQIDDAFRAEKPQRGRLRQFTQCDIDIIGDSTINAEIEILSVAGETLKNLGFRNFVFKINDRRILNAIIEKSGFNSKDSEKICIILDKRDKIGLEGIENELKDNGYEEENIKQLLKYIEILTDNGLEGLNIIGIDIQIIERITNIIEICNNVAEDYKVEFDCSIIRGQGYYTSTVMEVYLDGFNGACGGGGRYDTMIEKIINVSTCAVGFSIGYERVCLIMEESKKEINSKNICLVYTGDDDFKEVIKYSKELKNNFDSVCIVPRAKNFTNQLNKLRDNGYNYFVSVYDKKIKEIS